MLFDAAEAEANKLPLILDWKKISKRACKPATGFPDTRTLTSHEPISGIPLEKLKQLGEKMVAACVYELGIGLAAPQIGVFKNIIMIGEIKEANPSLRPDKYKLYVNPSWVPLKYYVDPVANLPDEGTLLSVDTQKKSEWEGCLSVRGQRFFIERFDKIMAAWFEYDNDAKQWNFVRKPLEGFMARVFQHETDHLFGRSIVDRAEQQKNKSGA